MAKENRSITQASELLNIKDVTLRKWEKDFKINIPKNELGHRYYTQKELDLLKQIKDFKDNGYTISQIQTILTKSIYALEQAEQALELVTLDKLTGSDVKQLFAQSISDIIIEREMVLKQEYEAKIEETKQEIKENLKKEFSRQQEQIQLENKKLIDYIENIRQEETSKGFFKKLFNKGEGRK